MMPTNTKTEATACHFATPFVLEQERMRRGIKDPRRISIPRKRGENFPVKRLSTVW
jgi:hypothetical protein